MQKVWTNSFQEVLEAVLFGGWSIPPTAHGWLLCGSPTRVSTTFSLSVGKILFELTCISNNVEVWYFDFGGKWENFVQVGSSRVSGLTEVCNFGHFWLSYGRCAMSGSPMGRSEVAPKQLESHLVDRFKHCMHSMPLQAP